LKKAVFLLGLLLLTSCYQSQPDVPSVASSPQVLGVGSVDIGVTDDGVLPASFQSGYVNIPSDLMFTSAPVSQLTTGSANGVAGRYLLTRVNLRNVSNNNLENLTLLGISLTGADQSLTAYSNVLTIIGTPVSDANALYQIKPSQPISQNGITNASFVAFDESDLDSDLRNTIDSIPGVSVGAVFPYGFRVGDVAAGQDATVDLGFFIPDGNPVGRFSFRFVAVTDNLERVTQGIDEIDVTGNRDNGYAAVRQRFGNPEAGKTLVLTGPFEREVSQADIDSGIFTLLPDIRIAGTAGNTAATLFASGLAAAAQVSAVPDVTLNAELMALLENNLAATDPGVVLFVGDNQSSSRAAYGLANIETNTPIKLTDYFRIASTSKPMVSAALLTFVDAGDIALDDPIADYLPADIVNNLASVSGTTVRQMLQMTSGIPDYLDTTAFVDAVEAAPRTFWTPAQMLEFAYDEPAKFTPGSGFDYSNSNYILAQIIIETLSEKTLAVVLKETVFDPAGMTDCYLETADTFAQNITRGYDNSLPWDTESGDTLLDVTEINDGVGLGDGGVVCRIDSLVRFLPALLAGDILTENTLAAMLNGLANDRGAPYGLGIDVDNEGAFGLTIGHDGATSGFQTSLIYLPEDNLSVAAITNFVESEALGNIIDGALEWWFE
jgi:D-alanyl-D-alanine carboxypeptidase